MRITTAALLLCAATTVSVAAQQPPPVPPPSPTQQQPPPTQTPAPKPGEPTQGQPAPAPQQQGRVLLGDAGVIFFPVKPEKVADFEKIMAKLKEALLTSEDPVRKEQAAGWKVFKAVEPGPNNAVLYVFLIDPGVKGSDYGFWKTIYDAFPKEVQELYRLYSTATAGSQSMLNLQLIETFGSAPQK